jgi:hypothetical protein
MIYVVGFLWAGVGGLIHGFGQYIEDKMPYFYVWDFLAPDSWNYDSMETGPTLIRDLSNIINGDIALFFTFLGFAVFLIGTMMSFSRMAKNGTLTDGI